MTEKVSASPLKCSKPAEIFRTNEVLNLMDADAVNTDCLREMLAKATPGPWDREGNDIAAHGAANDPRCDYYICEDVNGTRVVGATHGRPQDNAELIVAAVNALPILLDAHDRLAALEAELAALRADARGHEQTLRAALEFVSKFTSGNSVMRDVRAIAVRAGPTIAQEATFLRDQINARLLPGSGTAGDGGLE